MTLHPIDRELKEYEVTFKVMARSPEHALVLMKAEAGPDVSRWPVDIKEVKESRKENGNAHSESKQR